MFTRSLLTLILVLSATSPVRAEQSRILLGKITPVISKDQDGLSKAAADIQESTDIVNLANLTLPAAEQDVTDFLQSRISTPDDLKSLFTALSPASNSRALDGMAVNILSTLSVPADKEGDQTAIYALRLSKLMEFGALDSARKLYTANNGNSPSSGISEIGFTALFAGEKTGLACLEQNAVPPEFRDRNPSFWNMASLMCQGLLSPAAGDDDALRLTNAYRIYATARGLKQAPDWEDLNQGNPLDLMAYGRLGFLAAHHMEPDEIKKASTKSLALILPNFTGELEDWAGLLSESFNRGVLTANDVHKILADKIAFLKTLEIKREVGEFEKSLDTYWATGTAIPSPDALETIKRVTGSYNLMAPLLLDSDHLTAAHLEQMDWKPYTPEQTGFLIATLITANQPVPQALLAQKWPEISSLEKENTAENANLPTDRENLICRYLGTGKKENSLQLAEIQALCKVFEAPDYSAAQKIQFYDNVFNLTESGNYVMPTSDILSSLKKSAKKKPSLQMVIESLEILTAQPLEKLNPAVLYLGLQTISSAGLSVETKSIGREVLGHILENKKEN